MSPQNKVNGECKSDNFEFTPLYKACEQGQESQAALLLRGDADVNFCEHNGLNPLLIACQKNHYKIVELLLCKKADINVLNNDGLSPLLLACVNRHSTIVRLLLDNNADVNLCEKNGFSPLLIACRDGLAEIVQLLLSKQADINLSNRDGFNPLSIASFNGQNDVISLLIEKGANVNLSSKTELSPLFYACQRGHEKTAEILIENGAHVDFPQMLETKVLNGPFSFLLRGCNDMLQIFIDKDTNILDGYSLRPLEIAILSKHGNTVKLLLEKGANANLPSWMGCTPLHWSLLVKDEIIINHLLQNGAVVNMFSFDNTPLLMASCSGDENIVSLLLSKAVDININSQCEASPLHAACIRGHYGVVNVFSKRGISLTSAIQINNLFYI